MHFHSAPQHARMCVHNIRMSKQNTFDMDGHGWSPNSKTMGCGDSITSPTPRPRLSHNEIRSIVRSSPASHVAFAQCDRPITVDE